MTTKVKAAADEVTKLIAQVAGTLSVAEYEDFLDELECEIDSRREGLACDKKQAERDFDDEE